MASDALLLKRNEGYRVSFNPSNASEEAVLTIVFYWVLVKSREPQGFKSAS